MQDSFSPSGVDLPGAGTVPAPPPARSRRRWEWLIVAAAAGLACLLFNLRGRYGRGMAIDAPITLVTLDREDLGCASPRAFGRYRCEYRAGGEAWPAPPAPVDRLAAYYTEDRRLFLVPGLFEQPALAERYAREPPTGMPRDALRRFVAQCRLRLVERVESFEVRWLRSDGWHPSAPGWVAVPIECKVLDK